MNNLKKYLIIGGVRSGKSSYAEELAAQLCKQYQCNISYIATAEAFDEEMKTRIKMHQSKRKDQWQTYECVTTLVDTLKQTSQSDIVLIDCLTLWLNNCLFYQDADWEYEKQSLLSWLQNTQQTVIMVTNEVGFSITPENALARHFADQQGWLNQDIAKLVENVTFTIAGLPHVLKDD